MALPTQTTSATRTSSSLLQQRQPFRDSGRRGAGDHGSLSGTLFWTGYIICGWFLWDPWHKKYGNVLHYFSTERKHIPYSIRNLFPPLLKLLYLVFIFCCRWICFNGRDCWVPFFTESWNTGQWCALWWCFTVPQHL